MTDILEVSVDMKKLYITSINKRVSQHMNLTIISDLKEYDRSKPIFRFPITSNSTTSITDIMMKLDSYRFNEIENLTRECCICNGVQWEIDSSDLANNKLLSICDKHDCETRVCKICFLQYLKLQCIFMKIIPILYCPTCGKRIDLVIYLDFMDDYSNENVKIFFTILSQILKLHPNDGKHQECADTLDISKEPELKRERSRVC